MKSIRQRAEEAERLRLRSVVAPAVAESKSFYQLTVTLFLCILWQTDTQLH
ncbi:hypothetical protein [Chlorogloeopsis sp. ULAP02]|uniref:hypothetical protein n=1 Tax=Chlorogloeopsis sp. ULAP02 TaxID=3107926 RepID=UPI003134F3FC